MALTKQFLARIGRYLPAVHADAAAFHAVGTTMVPIAANLPDIRMSREEVDIHLFPLAAVVEARFDFVNDGAATQIDVGFPRMGSPGPFKSSDLPLNDFHGTANGVRIVPSEHRLDHPELPVWQVWKQRFAEGPNRLVVRYWTPLTGYPFGSRWPFVYVLRTGRFWKGRIGEAVVRVHGSESLPLHAVREAAPNGFEVDRESGRLTWRFVDFEPRHDVGLLVSPRHVDAHHLGMRVDDVLTVHEDRPEEGRVVTVIGGIFESDEGLSLGGSWTLQDERYWDSNIVVPDGIRCFDRDALASPLELEILVPQGIRPHSAPVPTLKHHVDRALVARGKVVYRQDRPAVEVDEIWRLDRSLPQSSEAGRRFPWLRSDMRWHRPLGGPFWNGEATRYADLHTGGDSGERARVW